VTGQAGLEQRYRRLLAWYPRAFRRENGPEILAVLMACARDGQRRPGLAEYANLIGNGLLLRLRPGVPRSARTMRAAVWLMYAGAAVSTLNLINNVYLDIALGSIDNNKPQHVSLPELTGFLQVPPLKPLAVALGIVGDLVVIALWVWLARSAGQRQNWARIAAATLFGLATLDLSAGIASGPLVDFRLNNLATDLSLGGLPVLALTWPVGIAVVCLLWLPASTAFFKRQDLASTQPPGPGLPGD
jgi:hypothetical protein